MTIRRKGNELIITLPENANLNAIQRLLDYIEYNELTINSKATPKKVDKLSSEINKSWWDKNKERLLDQ